MPREETRFFFNLNYKGWHTGVREGQQGGGSSCVCPDADFEMHGCGLNAQMALQSVIF